MNLGVQSEILEFIEEKCHGASLIGDKYGRDTFYISRHTVKVMIPINRDVYGG